MSSDSYRDGVCSAYGGEWVGEHLYRGLAQRAGDADQQAKLLAIADIEGLTHRRLRPIAARLDIGVTEAQWGPVVQRRAAGLYSLSWREFIEKAVVDWPPYIGRFAALLPIAPRCDVAAIQQLVDHEVVLVEFARRELAALVSACPPTDSALRVLRDFLDADDATAPGAAL